MQGFVIKWSFCIENIHSDEDFQNVVNAAAEKSDRLKKSRDKLLREISERENILKDGARYLELNKIKMPTAVQLGEIVKLNHLMKFNLRSEADIEVHKQKLERLKSELSETEKSLETAEKERSIAAGNYKTYLRQMQSDYDFVLNKHKREQEEVRQAERELRTTPSIHRSSSGWER